MALEAGMKNNIKTLGRITSTVNRHGYHRREIDSALSDGFKKVTDSLSNHYAKATGTIATPEMKAQVYKNAVKERVGDANARKARLS